MNVSKNSRKKSVNDNESLKTLKKIEHKLEQVFFCMRWMSAPLYGILALCLFLITIRGIREVFDLIRDTFLGNSNNFMLNIMEIIDLVMMSMLVTTVMFAGYENYISKMDIRYHPDYPIELLKMTFSQIKTKVTAAMTVMSGLNLYKCNYLHESNQNIYMSALVFVCFIVASVAFSLIEHSHPDDESELKKH